MARRQPHWKVVKHVNHKKFSDGGVIMLEEDPDVIYFDNSSDLPLSTSLNDLDNATLHIDGQSTKVDAPPDIIDLDEDDDIIDDEDALLHNLADSDDEDLVNVVDDDGVDMSADVARGHGGDGGGDDRPLHTICPPVAGVGSLAQAKALENSIWVEGKWNQARAAQNRQNQGKSTVVCRHGSQSLARLRDQMEEMLRLQDLGFNTSSGVPYTKEDINALARKGKQWRHLSSVGRLKKKNKYLTKQVNLMMKLFRSDNKFSQMLNQYESSSEFGNASGSGGRGYDEMADDEDGGEDEKDEEDGDSLESKVMRECCFVVERDAWLRGEFTLSSFDVLQGFSFFLQMGLTLILATFDGLDVGLLVDIIGEDDCDDDG
uniref:Uncharacterized protein n=1 Tax=Tanacetum cinerariifolium TaxID=118510 RepID=A0A6L2LDP7_TANCI|nr:hypothetical protein [Tanacetum cinerariifolium]